MEGGTLVGSELAGYRLESLIARGGMGVVYRASDPELSRDVAIKVIAPELAADETFRQRFLEEVEIAASLEHPHICPVYRAGEADGELYVCMRLLERESLAARVAVDGPLAAERTASTIAQLASALDYAHSRGLLHRDVKPENVLLDASGNAYLADFGLAGAIWRQEEDALFAGTLAYLAPERCNGEPALPASDLYALACLAHVLLTGEPPFPREHEAALLYAHLREEPPSLAEHGLARLDPVLHQALAKDHEERHATCALFASELASAVARPEPTGLETWPETLPRPASRLVGRRREVREVADLLARPETRLLTLTGPGGTGKTRLALEVAAESASAFPDGARWVALAPLRDPAHVLPALAQVLEVAEEPGTPLRDTLTRSLASRSLLLCLDNAEHLLPALADEVAALRDVPGGPTLLVTSRERLDLQAEQLYPVPALSGDEGLELFRERARLANPAFDPDDPVLPELCARLDTLPLALELAAARSDLYSPGELLEALAGHLELLRGSREHDPRHQTLQAAIAWSYELLADEEQAALRALSVFAGGASREAAASVAGAHVALLDALLAKSLLRTRDAPSGRRYWMLETIREYAAAELEAAGEGEATRERHARSFCELAVESEAMLDGDELPAAVERLTDETDNLRTAFAWALANDPDTLLRAVIATRRFAMLRPGLGHEAFDLLEAALARGDDVPPETRGAAHFIAGTLAVTWNYSREIGERHLDEAIALLEQVGDHDRLARSLNNRAAAAYGAGDWPTARSYFERAIALHRDRGDTTAYAQSVGNLGLLAMGEGDLEAARPLLEEALELRGGSRQLLGLAFLELNEGEVELATSRALEALELAGEDPNAYGSVLSDAHWVLARCKLAAGDPGAAREHLEAALDYFDRTPDDWNVEGVIFACASYAAAAGAWSEAVRLCGAAEAMGAVGAAHERVWQEELLAGASAELAEDEIESLLTEGRALGRDEATALARSALVAP